MKPLKNSAGWRLGVVAGAIAVLGGLASIPAHALGLGRLQVQSALGEPLRAEIDIAEISAEEATSLRAQVAGPDVFRTSGLEYNIVLSDLQITLMRRADGRPYLRLSGNRPVNEPFVDLLLQASWSSGSIVRDYTLLFDPPGMRQQNLATAPTAPILSRPVAPPSAAGLGSIPPFAPPATLPPAQRPPSASAAPVQRPSAAPAANARPAAAAGGQQLSVRSGDTAGRIAAQNKADSVSLDQMLVALLRSNPDAFIGGNVNRLKSGAVLELPTAAQASAVSPAEASRTIVAQSRDFNDFRRKLADSVTTTQVGSAGRTSGGQVQAKVEDRAPATGTPDKLTLSKGAVQGQNRTAAEDRIARDREAREASQRVAELSKNISDLNKLGVGTASPSAAAASAGRPATVPGVTVPLTAPATAMPTTPSPANSTPTLSPSTLPAATAVPAATSTAASPAAAASSATAAASSASAAASAALSASSVASAPAESASAPASADAAAAAAAAPASTPAPVRPPVVATPAAPVAEPGLLDQLTENPLLLPGIAALLLLLAGLGFYKYRKRGTSAQVDSSFLESRLQPDSFFGASGGQRVDTNEGGATGSSLVYSPSQLDAAGDVDPVAEADVYLAYGRDLQAEEILKEAMRTNPTRVAIHAKLMEIYAKRRDARAFEVVAIEAYNLTQGDGPEWAYVAEMGRDLDPSNALYQPGGQPSAGVRVDPADARIAAAGFGASTIPQMIEPERQSSATKPAVDFDLDLDFSLDEPAPATATPPAPPAPVSEPEPSTTTMPIRPAPEAIFQGLDMDFSTDTVAIKPPPSVRAESTPPPATPSAVDPVLSASGLTFNPEATVPSSKPVSASPFASAPEASDSGMLEFDLGSLSLDLDSSTPGGVAPVKAKDPLETKFELAEEFRALGDTDGARSLAEEVVAEAKGSLKAKAQAFLTTLS
ncbi:MAG: fimbrial protein FimV [Comamonadaceae bacterium]|nr:MAG: fimbrial protein FimV [Comamonadaceae bacterium]